MKSTFLPGFGYLYNMKKRVTGLGGVFFKSTNPQALKDWYGKHLHIESGEHGALFKWRQDEDPERPDIRPGAYFQMTRLTLNPPTGTLCSTTGWRI
jgi:hypothetical protein